MAQSSAGREQKLDSGATRFLERKGTGSGSKKRPEFKGVQFALGEPADYTADQRSDVSTLQLEVTPITIVSTESTNDLRQQIASNQSFICYALRQGHIRVLHKHRSERLLLKAHQQHITDLRFFELGDGADAEVAHHYLASASKDGVAAMWRLSERNGAEPELSHTCLLKIRMQRRAEDAIRSVSFHPTLKHLLALAVGQRVLFAACERDDQQDAPVGEEVDCDPSSSELPQCMAALPPALQPEGSHNVTSVAFSADGSQLAYGADDGKVHVARLAPADGPDAFLQQAAHAVLDADQQPFAGNPVGSIAWLGPEASPNGQLLIGDQSNSTLYIWDLAEQQLSQALRLQPAHAASQAPFNHLAAVLEPRLVVLANVRWAAMYVAHLSEDFKRFTSLVEFRTQPTLSIASWWQASTSNIQLYCIQTDAIQQYTLRPEQCLPADPSSSDSLPFPALSNGTPARSTSLSAPAANVAQPAAVPTPPPPAASGVSPIRAPGLADGAHQGLTVQTAALPAPGAPPSPSSLQQPQLITPTMLRHRVAGSRTSSQASSVFSEVLRDEDARAASAKASHAGSPHLGLDAGRIDAVPSSPVSAAPAHTDAGPPAVSAAAAAEPAPSSSGGLAALLESPVNSQVKILKRPGSITQRPPLAPEAPRPTPPAPPAAQPPAGPIASSISQADNATVVLPPTPPPPSFAPADRPSPAPVDPADSEATALASASHGGPAPPEEAAGPAATAPALQRAPSDASSSGSHDAGVLSDGVQSTGAMPARPAHQSGLDDSLAQQLQQQLAAVLRQLQASKTESRQLLEGVQKKLSQQAVVAEQRMLKYVREEVKKEGRRLETVYAAEVARVTKAQAKTIQEERKALLAEEHANIEKLLSTISASVNRDLPQRLEDLLKAQLGTLPPLLSPAALQPAVQAALATTLPAELAGSALQGALEKSLAGQLKLALRQPLQEGFRAGFQQQLIPAFEAACQNLFSQVQATFAGGLAEHLQAAGGANASVASSLQSALGQAQSMAQLLARDVAEGQRQLIRLASEHEAAGAARRTQEAAPPVDPKEQLLQLVQDERFEEAFNQVLHIGDVELVDWLCGHVEPGDLFSREPVPLSQGVLLSLVSQLSTDLSKDTAGKLGWMREATPAIDPHDEVFGPHMRPILQGLVTRLKELGPQLQGPNASQCRTVSHLVNSVLHQLAY